MLQLIDDETASRYYNEIDTATGDDLQTKMSALESWATAKKADQHRQEWDHVSGVFTDFDNYSAAEGLDAFDEESRYQYANRQFIAHQTGGKFEDQMFVYPSKRDEVTDQLFGKVGLSEKEAFNLFKGAVESRKASEEALRELPGVLAQGVLKRAGEGKEFDEVDSWFAFDGWKQRHADKLGAMPAGWETAMLDSAVKLHARTEALMADVAPESKRAMDVLMKFTRPEDAESLPDADRADVENLAKDFAKLTPKQRDGIYATLSYAAEAGGAGMGKGFWEKVGEGVARGGVNIYDDAAMTAEDRQARQNISFFQDLLDKPQAEPDRMQTAESIQMQRDMAQDGLDKNQQRLGELRVMREIRDLAQGRIDPIKTEMDGVLGSVVQGAYDFSQSAAYTGMAMVPYVGLPAVIGALANSNYLRMLDEYPDMDADAAYNLSLAIAGPQAVVERFQGGLLLGKLPYLNQAMKRLTDARVPLPARIGLGYAGVVGAETVTELAQEAMPVVADQLASAVREDMPEFDSEKAWGQYREQAPKIFYSMLWGGLIGGGAVGIRELERSGVYLRNVQELEMHGITGKTAEDIAAEQDSDKATTMFREAWDKRSPEDIQAGISKRAAMLDAAQATQANPDLPTRRVEQAPDGTITHLIEQGGQTIYRTSDPAAADMALINLTRMMDRSQITGTTTGIVESLQFIDQVNQAVNRGEDVQKLLLDGAPRTLLDEYEANPTEQNLDNLFATVRAFGQDISEPAELANFPVLASNQGSLAEGIFKSVIRIQDGATGVEVMRDFSQDNLKRALAENRITMDWVREQLNQVIPLIESDRLEGRRLRTETDTDVIESFSDVAVAYMNGRIRDEQVPAGFRGFLRRMAIVVKDIFRRAYRLKRAIAEGRVDTNFETFLAESVGLNQQTLTDTVRDRAKTDLITNGGQMLMDFSIGSRASAVSNDTPAIRAGNATIVSPTNFSIGAFHGTPHKVDKFSAEKIGTGEGAQAYGWGLYFAENRDVAETYRRALEATKGTKWDSPNQLARDAYYWVSQYETPAAAIAAIEQQLQHPPRSLRLRDIQERQAVLDYLRGGGQPAGATKQSFIYTVDLDVEPEDLLDWDKPLSEQSEKVQAALKAVQSDHWLWNDTISGKLGDPVGGAVYKNLTATSPDAEFTRDGIDPKKKASDALAAAGIPGIRYLDGGSRGAGEGTSNYVIFDESKIKITGENGQPVTMQQAQAGNVSTDTNYSIGSDVVVENGRAYSPKVRDLLQRRAAGENISRAVIDQAISENFPAQLVEVPKSENELPTRAIIDDAINEGQRRDRIDKSNIQTGESVTIRQDVPAMTRKGVGVVTVKSKQGNSYESAARIADPQFILNEKKSLEIGMGGAKGPHIAIRGKWSADQSMPTDLDTWTQVGFNPDRHSFYYDRATMRQVTGGSEAYQIGNTVFVKDAKFGDGQISDISYSIGKKQDADYLAAVERGDIETTQRMVDEAAKKAGYETGLVYHGTTKEFSEFKKVSEFNRLDGFYFGTKKDAEFFAKQTPEGRIISAYLSIKNPASMSDMQEAEKTVSFNSTNRGYKIKQNLINQGFDGAVLYFEDSKETEYVAFNPEQIKSADPVTYDDAGNVIPLSQRFNPRSADINYSIGKKDSLRVKMTRTALTDAALNQATWKDWYEEHQTTLDDFFGDQAQLFQDILSVTSQAASVKANVGLALKAFGQFHRGEEFSGFLPPVIQNLNRLREKTKVQGQKISAYKNSNDGKVDEAVIDRHISRLIFGVDSPSKAQFAKAQKILAEIANEIGWTPRQVQAALWAHSIYKSGKTPESYGAYLKKLESAGTIEQRIGNIARRSTGGNADGGRRGRFAPKSATDGAGSVNYSIRSVEHFKNDTRFDKLVKDGRVVIGRDIEDFKGMHILLHSPDNAFAGTIQLTDGNEIQGKGGVYYPALYADKNYFWASTEAMVMRTAKHLNEIGEKNGGKVLMGLVSAPVEKLFSSTSMATGVVKFLNALTSDTKGGLTKAKLNSMLVAASKVEFAPPGKTPKRFSITLKAADGLDKNLEQIDKLLEPNGSIFQVRKLFVESLAEQLAKQLNTKPKNAAYVAGILADAENKYAKAAIKRGKLSKASIMQGLGNILTEPFLRDFQDHGNGRIYAVLEVDGKVDGIATTEHDSYPATIVPKNKKAKVKVHVLNQAVDWQDVVGKDTGEYTTPEERMFLMPTSGMSATSLKVLGTKAGSVSNKLNYSISSQSEIDRVNKALGGMNRGPDARIAVYERAKQKFSTLIQNNQQALDNLRAGTVSFRRTQLLQALGELDAILSIFPPDLRGRVGGYTRLASIAPHDVFKDGEKISEVSGMNGAIISAWMREGLSIGPAGQQTELPPGYTAKENLSTARADRAIADFFKKRIEIIDRELEKTLRKEYDEAFRKLLDRTKPKKAKPGEKPKGIGGDIQDLFAVVRDSVDMSATQVAAHIAGLDSMIASGDLTAEQEARAQVEAALVALTGDWKNANADRRRTALMEATRIWSGAYAAHAQKVIQQREERELARVEAIAATGKAGDLAGRKSKAIADSGLKGSWKDYILNLLNFDQVVGVLFGENTEVANTIIDKQRRAENAKEDGSQAKMQELEDFFTGLAGGKVLDGERLRYRLTQPSMTVNGIEMSELEALSAAMMWVQEDGRRHMEGEMDETGKPSGAWHYNQAFVDEILANLSDEALALRSWLTRNYADEYAKINKVYSELNGVNLPQIQLYSPITVQPVNAPTGQVLDPVSGSAMSGASTSPGALRTRGTAIAEPRFQDVLQTYISHTLQMEHWKAFAPMIAEANGILRNRDVQNSVEEKGGAEARKMLNAWLDFFAQGGTRDAGAHLALNQGLNNVLGRASQVALVGRASTLLIQSTQLGAAIAEMPVKAYLKRMGKLLTGQLGWDAALNSDYIQRRVKQMPPVVQMAMQGLKGAKPTAIQQAGKRLGMLLSGADGLFTAGTYAITYDYHLSKAKELGLAGQEAEDYARNTAERVTDRIAQPTRAGARSLYENTSTNPLARAGWAFASEARKNLAITAYSFAERDTATKLRTLAYVVALNSIGASILRSIWRDILDDDDDELFDDKYWSPKRIAIAMATEPLYGFPALGSVVQEGVNKAFGEYKPSGSLFSVQNAIGPIKRLPDHLAGDTDLREVMRDIDMVVSALGIMHPNIAATASITHLAKDLFNLTDSAVDATTEE